MRTIEQVREQGRLRSARYRARQKAKKQVSMNYQELAECIINELRMYDTEHRTSYAYYLNDPDGAPLLAPILERVLADWCREHIVNQEVVQTLVRSKLP
jgi:hypothetical protein